MIPIKILDLDFYVNRLSKNQPFSLVRYGNGEWHCIFQSMGCTGSGSQDLNLPVLRQGLMSGIRAHQEDSSYLLAMQSRDYLTRQMLLAPVEQWLRINAPSAKWCCGEVFSKASMHGRLYPLITQLRKMNLVVVGPSWLQNLKKQVFPKMTFVPVRSKNCFITYRDLYSGIVRTLKECEAPLVVSFSAGPTAKVLIHELHNQRYFLIDFGSLWDPYVGKYARRYHKRVKGEILKRNLNG